VGKHNNNGAFNGFSKLVSRTPRPLLRPLMGPIATHYRPVSVEADQLLSWWSGRVVVNHEPAAVTLHEDICGRKQRARSVPIR
jgi:hypothetical protein